MLKDAAMATAAGADMVEVRLDKLWVVEQMPEEEPAGGEAEGESRHPKYVEPEFTPQPLDSVDVQGALESLKQGIELPVVLTCRPERQQGHYPGEEEQRIEILSAAIKSGVSWIDIEVDIESKKR
jgi:3-dehydroquinate dehydratase